MGARGGRVMLCGFSHPRFDILAFLQYTIHAWRKSRVFALQIL